MEGYLYKTTVLTDLIAAGCESGQPEQYYILSL